MNLSATTTAPDRDSLQHLLLAMAALMVGGTVALVAALLHHPGAAIVPVAAAMIVTMALWRPSRVALVLLGVYAAVEMLIPLHTGGGRIADWDLHYQLARDYMGLPATTTLFDMRQRTPLFNALIGGVLVWAPSFWVFQLLSVVLNALWIWPAERLLRHLGVGSDRVLAVGLAPMVVIYATYTWPWGMVSFFLLSAIYATMIGGRRGAFVAGVALAGALLVHVGAIGYALGIGLYVMYHRRGWRITAAGSVMGGALIVPWLLITHSSGGASSLWTSSIPALYDGTWSEWLISRPLMWASTFWGIPPVHLGTPLLDVVISLFFFSTTAIQLPLLIIGRRLPRPPAVALWAIVGGILAGTLLLPTNTAKSGLAETVFTANVIGLVWGISRLSEAQLRRYVAVTGGLAAVVAGCLIWRGTIDLPGDPNLALKVNQGLDFFVTRFTPLPGLAVAVITVVGVIVTASRWMGRRAPLSTPTAGLVEAS